MEGNDLVAKHVLPRGNVRGDRHVPHIVGGDQVIAGP
jgi:hypothetical protein